MEDTGILLVNFASADKNVRAVSTDKLTQEVKSAFPRCIVREVCSGEAVRKIIREKEGIKLLSLKEGLEGFKNAEVKRVICQSSYLMDGIEYDRLKAAAKQFSSDFECIKIGRTLTGFDFGKTLAKAMLDAKIVDSADKPIVMAGHGSAHRANSIYKELQEIFADMGFSNVIIATIESTPGIDYVLSRLNEAKKKNVTLMPLLSVAGNHSVRDIFGEEGSFLKALLDAGYEVSCVKKGLCEYAEIRDILIKSIAELVGNG